MIKASKVSVAYSTLKERILTKEYKYGQVLSSHALTEDLNMSRTPILEALKLLENEKLVSVVPQVGVMVNPLNVDQMRERFSAIAVLEGFMAGEAAKKNSAEGNQRLWSCILEMEQCLTNKDSIRYGELNVKFHETFWEMAENTFVKNLISQLHAERAHYDNLRQVVFDERNVLASIQEHKACAAAIAEGDNEGARKIIENHVFRSREKFMKALLRIEENDLQKVKE